MSEQFFGGRVFEGKTVFVTGGSGAIGGGCAEAIVRDGAAAMLMGRAPFDENLDDPTSE